MIRQFLFLLFNLSLGGSLTAQSIDTSTYSKLLKADKDEFLKSATAAGLTVNYDTSSQTLFAKTKGIVYGKPLDDKNNNENYDLVLLVSTLDKTNNKLILTNAKELPDKKGFWVDNQYLYREWDLENPITKEMWYKLIIYKRKK